MTRTPDGLVAHYNTVGYIAVACGVVTIWLAQHLRVSSTTAVKPE
jgi:hypothetical protein